LTTVDQEVIVVNAENSKPFAWMKEGLEKVARCKAVTGTLH
jgi:hypothetical protein